MYIRRTTYYDIITDSILTRAVAMSLFVKTRIKSSAVNNFSYNKLHKITGLHQNTCKRYVDILIGLNLAEFVGKNNNTLVFRKLHSRHQKHNIDLGDIDGKTIMDFAYHLYAIFNVEITKHKLFAKHIIATSTDGYKHVKEAKRKARKYGYGRDFIENGLSYKTIAKRLKCGIQKAQRIIKFCVDYGFLNIHHNITRIYDEFAQSRLYFYPNDYTYATTHFLYIVKANSYSLGSRYSGWVPLVG